MTLPLPPSAGSSATQPLLPVTPVAPVAAATSVVPGVGTAPATPVAPAAGAAPVAPTSPAAPAAPATPAPNLSAQAQQALRLQVFQALVAQLVTQVQSSNPATAPQWPASGVAPQLREMLSTLIAQATAGMPQPQQLVAVQPWPQAWLNTVLPAAPFTVAGAALPPAPGNPAPAGSAVALEAGAAGMPAAAASPSGAAPRLPPLLTWLVQQGVVQAPDGERGFALTLQVPQAWAQSQAMALPTAVPAGPALLPAPAGGPAPLQLPFAAPAQQLESGALALVLQGAGPAGERMRTSALLWLDFQPLPSAAQGAPSAAALASLLPAAQMGQQALALQARNDPWLQIAALQASGQQPRDDQRIEERTAQLCNEMACPYRARASCVQPFCVEMNRGWGAVGVGGV